MTPKKVGSLNEFLEGMTGEFIHVDCTIYPIMSFMYKNKFEFKREEVHDLQSYVNNMIDNLGVGELNVDYFNNYLDRVIELVINEHGILRISIKG